MSEPGPTAPRTGDEEAERTERAEFRWRAADELLTALAVSPAAHQRLADVHRATKRAEALGVPALFSGDVDDEGGAAPGTPEMSPQERAEVNSLIDVLASSALPLAAELLERLDAERIRPELVGLSRAGLGSALTVLEEAHRQGSWRALPDEDLAGRGAALSITVEAMVRTSPLAPERGETRRVVAVLRRMPKRTVTRFTRVWNPLLLRTMLSFGLRTLRKEAAEDAAHASGA